jgi:pimeloyl-ACP methyl ester carboxylesterase
MTALPRRMLFAALVGAHGRTPLLLAIMVATLAGVSRPGGVSLPAPAPASAAAQGPTISKLLIVAPGIDPLQLNPSPCPPINSTQGCYDAYARAGSTFQPLLDQLGCPQPQTPPSGTPFVPCGGTSSIAWIPFSYAGINNDGRPLPYTGAHTGQPLAQSASLMQQLVSFAQLQIPNASIVILAHSLGGAVSTYWGATSGGGVPVLTFDSPVNGIWPTDPETQNVYCNASVGLFTVTQQEACNLLFLTPAAASAAVVDLRDPETVKRMGSATQLNFANTVDAFVPSWFAVSRTPTLGAVLKTASCFSSSDPIFNHLCIIDAAKVEAAAYITSGTIPPLTPIRSTINLAISASSGGAPVDGTVTAYRLGQVVAQAQTSNGHATLMVPWLDVLLEFSYAGGLMSLGALPGGMTDLSLNFTAWTAPPRKDCMSTNPPVGGETVCTVTLATDIDVRVGIRDTIVSPPSGNVVSCTSTGNLYCLPPGSGPSVSLSCNPLGFAGCTAGTSFTVRIKGATAGPLTESIRFTQNTGSLPVMTFGVPATPAVHFGEAPASTSSPAPPAPSQPMTVTAVVWRILPPLVSEAQIEQTVTPVVGRLVEALIGSTVCGQGVTDWEGRVRLVVLAEPSASGCGRNGTVVTFWVNGVATTGSVTFRSGGSEVVALTRP